MSTLGRFDRNGAGVGRGALGLLAGVLDLGLEQAEAALRHARGVLGRSDLPEMATDCYADLQARGEVVLARFAPPAEAHMETLAKLASPTHGDHDDG